jgi:hypothetical protein
MHRSVGRRLVLLGLIGAAFVAFAGRQAGAAGAEPSALAQVVPKKTSRMDANRCISELKRAMGQQRIRPQRDPYQRAIDLCKKTGDLAAAKAAVGAK